MASILSAHPSKSTARVRVWANYSTGYCFRAPLRRLCGITTRTMHVDILRNRANIIRPSWDVSVTFCTLTIAVVRKAQ